MRSRGKSMLPDEESHARKGSPSGPGARSPARRGAAKSSWLSGRAGVVAFVVGALCQGIAARPGR
eukprot:5260530-Pyramimonas_sp.AAC.1